jgi:hypothetical protein
MVERFVCHDDSPYYTETSPLFTLLPEYPEAGPNNCAETPTPSRRVSMDGESIKYVGSKALEVFFCSILRTTVQEYVDSHICVDKRTTVWAALCKRANLSTAILLATGWNIKPKYKDKNNHFAIRAALVLEEVRHSISDPLVMRWDPLGGQTRHSARHRDESSDNDDSQLPPQHSKIALTLELIDQEHRDHDTGISVLTFLSDVHFSTAQLGCLGYGMVFECIMASRDRQRCIAASILGWIMETDKVKIQKSRRIEVAVYCPIPGFSDGHVDDNEWVLRPICNCIASCYQFDALTSYSHDVPFLDVLLGNPSADASASIKAATGIVNVPPTIKLRPLNDTQKLAMESFLNSSPNSITIVQG